MAKNGKGNKIDYCPIDLDTKIIKRPYIHSNNDIKNKEENSKSTNTSVTKNDKQIRTQFVKKFKDLKTNLNKSVDFLKSNKTTLKDSKNLKNKNNKYL